MKCKIFLLAVLFAGIVFGASGDGSAFSACSYASPCMTSVAIDDPRNIFSPKVKVFGPPFTSDQSAHIRTFWFHGGSGAVAYSATAGFLCSSDGHTWDAGTSDTVKLTVTNAKPDTEYTPPAPIPCTIYGFYLLVNSGVVDPADSTNKRHGLTLGINGGF